MSTHAPPEYLKSVFYVLVPLIKTQRIIISSTQQKMLEGGSVDTTHEILIRELVINIVNKFANRIGLDIIRFRRKMPHCAVTPRTMIQAGFGSFSIQWLTPTSNHGYKPKIFPPEDYSECAGTRIATPLLEIQNQ
jgi:hypothetical protein